MKKIKGLTIAAAILIIAALGLATNADEIYQKTVENDFIKSLITKLDKHQEEFPEDRVYLQFDKPLYKPGETIWFSAFVRNGMDLKASQQSEILHVDLINPRGSVQKSIKLIAKKGHSDGDFLLDESVAGGMYKVRAWTNWQKNEKDTVWFEKELQVQKVVLPRLKMKLDFERKAFGAGDQVIAKLKLESNQNIKLSNHPFSFTASLKGKKFTDGIASTGNDGEMYITFDLPDKLKTDDALLNVMIEYEGQTESISRAIPIVLNHIKFSMFPEGGDLIMGQPTKVAFKALSSKGKAADVAGIVYDQNGKEVTEFSSFHNGMGAFRITPGVGKMYYVKLNKPANIDEKFYLPEALAAGYVLNTKHLNDKEISVRINSSVTDKMSLLAQVRGKVYYATELDVRAGQNKFIVPTDVFPIGVAQFTLFDSREIARCERLVFVNKDKQLKIDIETDKEQYQPRDKVKMTVRVKDERGMPMPAQLSLAVSDDQLLTFADDKSGNILSQLLLEQDLNTKVEEAAFYFDDDEVKSDDALDYLLMSSGWRRFQWEEIIEETKPLISFQPERAILQGLIKDGYSGKIVKGAKIKNSAGRLLASSDKDGQFTIDDLDLSIDRVLAFNADGFTAQQVQINNYGQQNFVLFNQNNVQIQEMNFNRRRLAPGNALKAIAGGVRQKNAEEPMPMAVMAMPEEIMDDANIAVDGIAEEEIEFEQAEFENNIGLEKDEALGELQLQADRKEEHMDMVIIADERFPNIEMGKKKDQAAQVLYTRARVFPSPQYDNMKPAKYRNDYRSTIFWDGKIDVDKSGKAEIEFHTSDAITSFKATIEGIASDGMLGRTEAKIFNQLPVNMTVKAPVEVVAGDLLTVPLFLKNNTNKLVQAKLNIEHPQGFRTMSKSPATISLAAGQSKVLYLDYNVVGKSRTEQLNISLDTDGFKDAFQQIIEVKSKGFPASASFSGNDKSAKYSVDVDNLVDGSLKVNFTAYPSVVNDLLKGVEGILREPGGCFEQTSMSSYPNVMVMDYLNTREEDDPKLMAHAGGLLDRGYNKLIAFETSKQGYDWFGRAPANEALTAYGLMQFNDMKAVSSKVDQGMIDRTAKWLMSRKDGKGGFQKHSSAADSYGRASETVTNAYIVYALAEAGYGDDINKEYSAQFDLAKKSDDPYILGLMANASIDLDDTNQATIYDRLMENQKENGGWCGTDHSITRSTGRSLEIETTSLAIMAMLKKKNPNQAKLDKAVKHLITMRSGNGGFGNTQGTILALKALTGYAKFAKKTDEAGTIEIWVDGVKVHTADYEAGRKDAVEIKGLEVHLTEGKNNIRVTYKGVENPLPYSLAVNWNTFLPKDQNECQIKLTTSIDHKGLSVGETARLNVTLKNKTDKGLASPLAIIGIPAGFTFQPWQLKKMQEEEVFDFYELNGNNVVLYYRQMAPSEVKELSFDLKAELSGSYEAPASCAYLYYTNEFKDWTALNKVQISK